jgi:pectin methylesterase-like acyl-CoA thioesterase
MAQNAGSKALVTKQVDQSPTDRYESTFVVSPDPLKGDFTTLQDAIAALPPAGGKIFVKAGAHLLTSTIKLTGSNIHVQGEGMGITVFTADSTMTWEYASPGGV